MSIVRGPSPKSEFYVLRNSISQNRKLSWQARGLLIYLLSKPLDWKVSVEALRKETEDSKKPTGRDGIYAMIAEIEAAGYMRKKPGRDDLGRISGYEYEVVDEPFTAQPDTAQPDTANPTLQRTDSEKELKVTKPVCSEEFEVFWKLYPKKKGKKEAEKAWRKVKAGDVSAIMQSLAVEIRSEQWLKNGGQYIPNPATWLNGERWNDEVQPAGALPASKDSRPPLKEGQFYHPEWDAGQHTICHVDRHDPETGYPRSLF